jgi:hypothetical protein
MLEILPNGIWEKSLNFEKLILGTIHQYDISAAHNSNFTLTKFLCTKFEHYNTIVKINQLVSCANFLSASSNNGVFDGGS